ncbi:MAG: glycosyltransferase family 4 protein [Nanoarchaeota archaeon]
MVQNKSCRILEICPFSAGICGIWQRVISESKEFTKLGYEVRVFSSDIEKGTGRRVVSNEEIDGIKIERFKCKRRFLTSLVSSNVKYWFGAAAIKSLEKYNPQIIITHLLHPHSAKISKLTNKLKKKNLNSNFFIVPHAPFNIKRGFILDILTSIWQNVRAVKLNNFDRVIAITAWERPYLLKSGIQEDKIVYIPNGLPDEFFTQKMAKSSKDVLFLGRISPVKHLETLINAAKSLPNINFTIVGAAEDEYMKKIKNMIKLLEIKNIEICPPVYNLREKIRLIDRYKLFVLPSKREAMPQVLIEAMARGKVVISSKTDGGKEIIKDNVNGFLFEIGDYKGLASIISKNIFGRDKIQKRAMEDAKKYSWKKLIKRYLSLFNR